MYIQVQASHEPLRASPASVLDYFWQLTSMCLSTKMGHSIWQNLLLFSCFVLYLIYMPQPVYGFPSMFHDSILLCACCLLATGSRADCQFIVDFGGFCANSFSLKQDLTG